MLVVLEMCGWVILRRSVCGKYERVFRDRGWARGNTEAYSWEKKGMSKLPMEHMTQELMGESAKSKCQRNPHSRLHQCLMNFVQITLVYLTKVCFFCSPAQAIKACESCPGHLTSILGQLSKDTQREGGWKTQLPIFQVSWQAGRTVAIDRGKFRNHDHFEGSWIRITDQVRLYNPTQNHEEKQLDWGL